MPVSDADLAYFNKRSEDFFKNNKKLAVYIRDAAEKLKQDIADHKINSHYGVCSLLLHYKGIGGLTYGIMCIVDTWPCADRTVFPIAGPTEFISKANKYDSENPYLRRRLLLLDWVINECCRILGEEIPSNNLE